MNKECITQSAPVEHRVLHSKQRAVASHSEHASSRVCCTFSRELQESAPLTSYLPSLALAALATGITLDTEARMLVLVAVATAGRAMLMPELTTSLTPGATSAWQPKRRRMACQWVRWPGRTCDGRVDVRQLELARVM